MTTDLDANALEPALIGDQLAFDAWDDADEECENAAIRHWEGIDCAPWPLAGTVEPGAVWLKAGREAASVASWFSDDQWALPPSCDTAWARSVSAIVRDIFGDLGLMPDPLPVRVPGAALADEYAQLVSVIVAGPDKDWSPTSYTPPNREDMNQ